MSARTPYAHLPARQQGLTLVELMVALAIGLFLIGGVISVFGKTRDLYRTNESAARLQETARYALSELEGDIRMANHWGPSNQSDTITNLAAPGEPLEATLAPFEATIDECGDNWAIDLAADIDGDNNGYALDCPAFGTAAADADVLTIRRASFDTIPDAGLGSTDGQFKLRSSRSQATIFPDTTLPAALSGAGAETRALVVHSYYVSADSDQRAGTPSLRRKRLGFDAAAGVPVVEDEQVVPAVEDLQFQLAMDRDGDQSADYYAHPDLALISGDTVVAVRLWLLVRAENTEVGFTDDRDYLYADRALYRPADGFRRLLVSKTVQLRNTRR